MVLNYQCDICNEPLYSYTDLQIHMQANHDDGHFKCDVCNEILRSNGDLQQHMKNVHMSYKCDLCGMTFGEEMNLNKHMEFNHSRVESDRTLQKITCFKNIEKCKFLQAVAVTNIRSLSPKINTCIQDFKMRELSSACLTET